MSKFVPEVKAEDADGMSSVEAQGLLDSLRSSSLDLFKQNLRSHLDGARASILEENPLLAEEDMQPIVDDMVLQSKVKIYYKELQASLRALQTRGAWMSGIRTSSLLQCYNSPLISQCNGNALFRADEISKAQSTISKLGRKGLSLRHQLYFRDRHATCQART